MVPYASVVGSLQYAQVCTCLDLAFVTGLVGRFQSNPRTEHWKLVKKVLRCLQGTKSLMMTYRRSDSLHIVGYSDSDYARDDRKCTSGYVFTLAGIIEKMLADPLTKDLPPSVFREHAAGMGLRESL